MSKSAAVDKQTAGQTTFQTFASLLDAVDRPLLVSDRGGNILFTNLHAQDAFRALGLNGTSMPDLFRDVLGTDRKQVLSQLEAGEQEVNLPVRSGEGKFRGRVRWLPEPDWLAVFIESAPSEPPTDEAEMRQTVQELMQEREITYRNLLAAYLRLQEANRQKTVFLASAAHELKTPLAVMKGYYELLLTGSLGKLSERQIDILRESKESCDRLVRLVSMFLNYSALESGKLVMHLRENDPRDCLNELGTLWRDAFARNQVRLELRLSKGLEAFKFDYQKVQQTVANLLDNALKHTPSGGQVALSAEPHFWERRAASVSPHVERRRGPESGANSLLVSVADSGPGIAPEHHQEIFEDFVRVDRSSSGMGLGLAISKRLVQAHRGKIWVDSEVGRGCTVKFLLPMDLE